jgi:hypothetical protein
MEALRLRRIVLVMPCSIFTAVSLLTLGARPAARRARCVWWRLRACVASSARCWETSNESDLRPCLGRGWALSGLPDLARHVEHRALAVVGGARSAVNGHVNDYSSDEALRQRMVRGWRGAAEARAALQPGARRGAASVSAMSFCSDDPLLVRMQRAWDAGMHAGTPCGSGSPVANTTNIRAALG